jgi:D-3-phosphoglycerate dehydrogenase
MAAETLRLYIEHGTVRHSVNFPDTNLNEIDQSCIRITVVNENKPGVLSKITEVFAKHNMNIVQQINQSRGAIAYNVIDVDPTDAVEFNLKDMQREVTMLEGCLSSRVLFGMAGVGYARNIDGEYHV